jgi:hypothetical protein
MRDALCAAVTLDVTVRKRRLRAEPPITLLAVADEVIE